MLSVCRVCLESENYDARCLPMRLIPYLCLCVHVCEMSVCVHHWCGHIRSTPVLLLPRIRTINLDTLPAHLENSKHTHTHILEITNSLINRELPNWLPRFHLSLFLFDTNNCVRLSGRSTTDGTCGWYTGPHWLKGVVHLSFIASPKLGGTRNFSELDVPSWMSVNQATHLPNHRSVCTTIDLCKTTTTKKKSAAF